MKNSVGNRSLQKFVLAMSVIVIAVGIYLIVTVGFSNFFTIGMRTSEPPSTRHQPFLVLFIVALVLAFFTGKNLLRRK